MNSSAEVICVGTELLLGEILNRNAQFLGQQLAQLGIPHFYQTVVGDNPARLQKAVQIASDRAQILIFTGGLGPTPDDLTTETLANFFAAPLVEQPDIRADIERKFAHRGLSLTPNNYKQALIPAGAQVLPNPTGTAPGMIWQPRANLIILTFPGVPSEMQRMWQDTAVPFLHQQGWGREIIYSRVLRFWGISESALAEQVAPFFNLQNPTVAPYAGKGEARLRISVRARSETDAEALIQPIEQQLRQTTGLNCYGCDEQTLASVVGELLQATGETVSVAESCTGGGLGQMLTAVSGSSSYFQGGVIAYSNAVKATLLQVQEQALAEQGAVSAAVAQQMAKGVQSALGTTWGLSITGIAGPGGGSADKPVGLVYIGLAGPDGVTSFQFQFGSIRGRDWVRHVSACNALDQLRRCLLQRSPLVIKL